MPYSTIPFVNYWRVNKKGEKPEHVNWVCFGLMESREIPVAIRYVCPINNKTMEGANVTVEQVDFYLNFMKRLIKRPESPKFSVRRLKDKIYYRLETAGLSYTHALFFLTWFRYPHEFPEMVRELSIRKAEGDDDEALFKKFQDAHFDQATGKVRPTSPYQRAHGLISNRDQYSGSRESPITISKIVENIKSRKSSVHDYFR